MGGLHFLQWDVCNIVASSICLAMNCALRDKCLYTNKLTRVNVECDLLAFFVKNDHVLELLLYLVTCRTIALHFESVGLTNYSIVEDISYRVLRKPSFLFSFVASCRFKFTILLTIDREEIPFALIKSRFRTFQKFKIPSLCLYNSCPTAETACKSATIDGKRIRESALGPLFFI